MNAPVTTLHDARWSKEPPVPIALLAGAFGLALFGLVLLALRYAVGAEAASSWNQPGARTIELIPIELFTRSWKPD